MGVLIALMCLVVGLALGWVGGFLLGTRKALEIGKFHLDNYVVKLTPEDLRKLDNSNPQGIIDEELLWANDLPEQTVRKNLGFEEEPNY